MDRNILLVAALLAIACNGSAWAQGTTAVYVSCIVHGDSSCTAGGFDNTDLKGAQIASAAGYYKIGDGGGGTFALGPSSNPPCAPNGGSIINDDHSPTKNCYYRVNSSYGPKEFGARGTASMIMPIPDDTAAIQSWLDANQPHLGDVDTYMVSKPLKCQANTTIQGPSNVSTSTPLFTIEAFAQSSATPFSGLVPGGITQAVIGAFNFCRISGVGIVASQPISETGSVSNTSTTITFPSGTDLSQVLVGNAVTDTATPSDIAANTTVVSINSGCVGAAPCVVISVAAIGTNGSDTINFSSPISLPGTTNSLSKTITFLSTYNLGGVQLGNAVTDSLHYIPTSPPIPNTTVSVICPTSTSCTPTGSSCTPAPCVQISQAVTCTTTCGPETITFWGPDAVDVLGGKVAIDGFSTLSGGRYNVDCGDNQQQGELQIKDSLLQISTSDNVYMTDCPDARLIGDHFSGAGTNVGAGSNARGVVFEGLDLVLADGTIDGSEGNALDLESAFGTGVTDVTVTGMNIATNGVSTTNGGYGVYIKNASTVSICGNLFHGNDAAVSSVTGYSADVFFDGTNNSGISFCGNSYLKAGSPNIVPQYVYDASSSAALASASFYENPNPQELGVLSPYAGALLPPTQVLPATRAFLTGLALSNDTSSATTVDIAPGNATDSTGFSVIPNPSVCKVDLAATNGLNGLDTGSLTAITTYFYFVIADLSPQGTGSGTASPSCIASKGLAPNLLAHTSYGHGIWRLVGALYTDNSSPTPKVVSFTQDGDTFYLASPVTDIQTGGPFVCTSSISTLAVSCPLSVPCGRTAATCASLPSPGFAVEGFGRIVGGTQTGLLYLSSPSQLNQAPVNFPTAPGFTTANGVSSTFASAYPFRLKTDASGQLRARASASGTTAYEITDGWVWHRQQ